MKFLHLADLHLGKSLGDFDLIKDQEYILKQVIDIIDQYAIDGVLIAGDVYDKSIPSEAAVKLLDSFLSDLAVRNVKTYMISGNHDSDDRLNYGSNLFTANQIYISAVYDGTLRKYPIEKEGIRANVYLLPFVKASYVKHFYPDADIKTYEDAVRVILEHTDIDETEMNILVAHQFVAGKGIDPSLGGSEGVLVQNVGLVDKIGYDLFDQFDYVALGHIHAPQKIGREQVRYAGSPLKYSFSEVNNEKSVPVISIGNDKHLDIELIPLKPKRNVRHIKGKMADLLHASSNNTDSEDFIFVTITDEEIINDAMGIFQETYHNTVKIFYDNSHTREIEQFDLSNITQNKSFSELISEFYSFIYHCDISEEEMSILRMAAREAGVIDETN